MPPTDLMKILSRTDHLVHGFLQFIQNMGFYNSQGNDIINILPYTSNIIYGEEPLLCLGMSICSPISSGQVIKHFSKNFNYDDFSLELPSEGVVHCLDNLCKICGINNFIVIYSSNRFETMQIVKDNPFELLKTSTNVSNKISPVLAIRILGEKEDLSIVFLDPARIMHSSPHHIFFEYYGDCIYISKDPIMLAVRRLLVEKTIYNSQIAINGLHYTPFIEVVDTHSILIPQDFHNRCIEMNSYNITHDAINSIIRVYSSRVTKVQIDDAEYEYRHNIIRMALAPLSKSRIKLCLQPKI